MLTVRLAPPMVLTRPTRIVQRNMLVYRHSFMVIFSGFFEPLFYLFSMGLVSRFANRCRLADCFGQDLVGCLDPGEGR